MSPYTAPGTQESHPPRRMRWCGLLATLLIALAMACSGSSPSDSDDDGDDDPETGSAQVFYVATGGNDADSGTKSAPWQTIGHAAATLAPGDTVYVRAGFYAERVILSRSGQAGAYITYLAHPGESVTIDGRTITLPSEWGGLFDISERSYIKVAGFRVAYAGPGAQAVGILVDESHHVTLEDNETYNTVSSGIACWNSRHITIVGNDVELACNGGENECLTVAVTDTFEVRDNTVHHNGSSLIGGEGIDIKDGSSFGTVTGNHVHHIIEKPGLYIDAWDKHTHDITVCNNLVHDIEGNGIPLASESGGLLENITICNNIVYNAKFVGIALTTNGDAAVHPMQSIRIINNTVYNCGIGEWGGGIGIENLDATDVIIRNNIVSRNLSFQIARETDMPDAALVVDHNLIDGYREYEFEILGTDSVLSDPLFVNAAAADFHLTVSSPARDGGSAVLAPATDYEGTARPQGDAVDIGAYEYPEE